MSAYSTCRVDSTCSKCSTYSSNRLYGRYFACCVCCANSLSLFFLSFSLFLCHLLCPLFSLLSSHLSSLSPRPPSLSPLIARLFPTPSPASSLSLSPPPPPTPRFLIPTISHFFPFCFLFVSPLFSSFSVKARISERASRLEEAETILHERLEKSLGENSSLRVEAAQSVNEARYRVVHVLSMCCPCVSLHVCLLLIMSLFYSSFIILGPLFLPLFFLLHSSFIPPSSLYFPLFPLSCLFQVSEGPMRAPRSDSQRAQQRALHCLSTPSRHRENASGAARRGTRRNVLVRTQGTVRTVVNSSGRHNMIHGHNMSHH